MKRIAIIENDQAILDLMSFILEEEGYEILPSDNSSALNQLQVQPHLIILDEWLNDEKGSTICNNYKNNPETAHIPIILVSAINQLKEVATECKADGFIEKPFNIDALLSCIKENIL
ncbi:MAG: phoB 4 [Sphingobacteriales bacterium]|nr:phoB 4 [Sphingobacteriales bacterium]